MLEPLATVDDVAARLGSRDLDDADLARIAALLDDASAAVRRRAGGQQITAGTSTVTLPVRRGRVRLPQHPVTGVTSVFDPYNNGTTFMWDGVDTLVVGVLDLTYFSVEPWRYGLQSVTVTYSHGYDEVPADLVAVVCQMVGRAFGMKLEDSGIQQETIDTYSYTVGTAAASGGVGMLPAEAEIVAAYATRPHVIQMGIW